MSKIDIEFLKIVPLRGPNMWTYRPVLEAWIDIHDLEDAPSNTIPGFYERLSDWLPSLIEHRCSYGEHGGFLRRVKEGTWPGHILEHVTLELQNLAGLPGGFGKTREVNRRGIYKVVVRAWQEDVTRAALYAARDLILAAMEDRPFDVAGAIARLTDMADSLCLGPSTACIVDAAEGRKIPTVRLLPGGNLVQIGYGAAMRRIWTAETDRTSAIAETISRDKDLTKTLLSSCGVPVPEGREADSAGDAWEAAQDIGLPVCVKPVNGNHGRGVFIDVKTREEVEKAYSVALDEGSGVLVERSIPGTEHRLLIVGGKLAAATRGGTVCVAGDGKSTVRGLIETQINSDPRRGESELHPLSFILIDSAVDMELTRQGFDAESVPPKGKEVLIQRTDSHAFDVTDEVHPDNAALAALAARIVGLDIAGIDVVAEEISKPLIEQRGAIVEVNAGPSLLMHLKPAVGQPRPVGRAIVDHLFPEGETGRIPIVGISGSRGKTSVARCLGHLARLSGKYVGLACSEGLFLDRRRVQKTDAAEWAAARRLLMNRTVEIAILENGARAILGEGLAYDRCQVGVVTNMDPEEKHIDFAIEDAGHLFHVLRTQVDVVLGSGVSVLNADDPQLVKMATLSDGEVIFFARDDANPAVAEHCAKSGRAVFVNNGEIMLAVGDTATCLARLTDIPAVQPGKEPFRIDNTLAALAAAWALGVPPELLAAGIKTFAKEELQTGRSTAAGSRHRKKN